MNRRDLLRSAAGLAASLSLGAPASSGWDLAPEILKRIKPPTFKDQVFDITRYGAASNGGNCGEAIARAIAECGAKGGGRVVVPAGLFITGPVHLKSNVNLVLAAGATLRFSSDPKLYLPVVRTRYEGIECMNYSPLVYAFEQENIAITGSGTLDGGASRDNWWAWRSRTSVASLVEMGEKDVPLAKRVFGEGFQLRPCLWQPYRCKNVLIEGVTVKDSPMYNLNPVMCTNVTVRNVAIFGSGPNTDGCDPDSCRDMLIEGCKFSTGDDCIAVKSGRNRDGRQLAMPSENLIVRDCDMKDGHGALTVGSECSGGIRRIFFDQCRLDSPHLNQALRIKTNAMRGGVIEDIYYRDITIGQISDSVLQVDFYYQEGEKGPEKPVVRNIDIRNVTSKKSKRALFVRGFPSSKLRGLHLENCTFDDVELPSVVENVEEVSLKDVRINEKAA
jgi:polygalacturonase